jgi:hypothetical protein
VDYLSSQIMEVNQVIGSATSQVENRVATLADLRALMDSIREEIAILRNPSEEPQIDLVTEEARREIHSLQQEVIRLREARHTTPLDISRTRTREPKACMPDKFDGTRANFWGFVQQVRLYLRLYSSYYPDGFTQVAFIGTLLSGNARSWLAPLLEKDSPILYNLEAFLERFTAAFGDSDRERVAERKIQNLCQGTRSAAIYAAEFQQLTCDLDWNDKAYMTRFRYGLKDDVKNLLITMPKVDTLEELISQAITCDNRLFELRQERRSSWRNDGVFIPRPKSPENRSTRPEPMQIDAARFKTLTPEEKERRMENGLCLYCGEEGHKAGNCHKKLNRRTVKTRSALIPENDDAQPQ